MPLAGLLTHPAFAAERATRRTRSHGPRVPSAARPCSCGPSVSRRCPRPTRPTRATRSTASSTSTRATAICACSSDGSRRTIRESRRPSLWAKRSKRSGLDDERHAHLRREPSTKLDRHRGAVDVVARDHPRDRVARLLVWPERLRSSRRGPSSIPRWSGTVRRLPRESDIRFEVLARSVEGTRATVHVHVTIHTTDVTPPACAGTFMTGNREFELQAVQGDAGWHFIDASPLHT